MDGNIIDFIYSTVKGGGKRLIEFLKSRFPTLIASHCLDEAVGFYRHLGFTLYQDRVGLPDYILRGESS